MSAALAVVVAISAPVAAQVGDGPSRLFTGRDLFGLRAASDPQVSPDGRSIAYVRTTYDIMTDAGRRSIWLVDAQSGGQSPLVSEDSSSFTPRWSPDGSRLAYVMATPGGAPQLYVHWIASGRSAKVATLEQAPNDIAWSPDGRTLGFSMLVLDEGASLGAPMKRPEGARWADPLKVIDRITYRADGAGYLKPGYRKLFVVSADGGSPRQVTFGKFDDQGPISFTADGRGLLFSTDRKPGWERDRESDIYQVAIADGALTRLTDRVGPDGAPAVSPDGAKIAYVGYDDERRRGYENQRLYVMDRDGGNKRVLTGGLDRSVGAPQWAPDGRSIYVDYVDKGVTKVARVGLDGRLETVVSGLGGGSLDRPYSGGDFSVGRGGIIAYTESPPDRPADLAVWRGGKSQRLTRLNDDLLANKTMARVEHLPAVSSYDQKPIDAWVALPPNYDPSRRYPLILEIHGGPFQSYGPSFSTDVQLYAKSGYVVVYSNPRGSTSYGEAFANEIDRNYPSHDYDDLMSVVDAAIAKGYADPNRLYVTGGSGGGALTSWIVGKTDRFKAAATQKPVINWTSQVLTVDGYTFMARYWFGKMPWEDPQGYWARSPLSLVGNVKTPTLVVVGEEDYRTPPPESEQYYQALQLRGVPTALVRVPGASHGGLTARPSQSAAKAEAILAWFERYK
ncbi:S9 family peptidase [Phenylobacterium sp. J367]|uniref:alpha/beta hydrolase family protein n=1 Tax=Phenylobacterium sp. J367 TaxID=2898435 RepID=UPI002150CF39|nr:S9 family peptidase [Phenylobacterium sp. J367]MCR5881035.1 S9 family peptidase [Phenylobacterium sp. J367]